jgi:hypothetical protein
MNRILPYFPKGNYLDNTDFWLHRIAFIKWMTFISILF